MNNKSKKALYLSLTVIIVIVLIAYYIVANGFTAGPDKLFGDQNLKTTVALIEMHKIRNGVYPKSLDDLKFLGEWDKGIIQSVNYYTNCDQTKYFVKVTRGWVAQPNLTIEPEFWHGTGYEADLQTCKN